MAAEMLTLCGVGSLLRYDSGKVELDPSCTGCSSRPLVLTFGFLGSGSWRGKERDVHVCPYSHLLTGPMRIPIQLPCAEVSSSS